MKLEKSKNSKADNNTAIKVPEKLDALLDERLILKMDEEAPAHPFPNIKESSNHEQNE